MYWISSRRRRRGCWRRSRGSTWRAVPEKIVLGGRKQRKAEVAAPEAQAERKVARGGASSALRRGASGAALWDREPGEDGGGSWPVRSSAKPRDFMGSTT